MCISDTLDAVKRASESCCQDDLDIGLHNSCMEGRIDVATWLLRKTSASPKFVADQRRQRTTVAMNVASGKSLTVLRLLFDHPSVGVNDVVSDGTWTALHVACDKNRLEVVQFLIGIGADVNKTTNGGIAPLFYCYNSQLMSVLYLAGANIEVVDTSNNSLLHAAANDFDASRAKFLCERGVRICTRNNDGMTPLDVAKKERRLEVSLYLEVIIHKRGEAAQCATFALLILGHRRCDSFARVPPSIMMRIAKLVWASRRDPVWDDSKTELPFMTRSQ